MKLVYDVIIPTRWDNEKLWKMLVCLADQTVLPHRVIVLSDKPEDVDMQRWELSLHPLYETWWDGGVAAKRNIWIRTATSPFVLLLDDDNEFWPDFVERLFGERQKVKGVVTPTIMRRKTSQIQSRGFRGISPWTWLLQWASHASIRCVGWNSLWGQRETFLSFLFDETIPFVYEDIEWSMRLSAQEPLHCVDVPIFHMEREKTRAEKSFVASSGVAARRDVFRKVSHGLLVVRRHFRRQELLIYCLSGFWLYHGWLFMVLMIYGKKKIWLLWSLIRWIWHGLLCDRRYSLPATKER